METYNLSKKQSWLSWIYRGLLIIFFLIVSTRLLELQVIKGSYYKILSEGNRIRKIPIPAKRGEILARGGEVLVGSKEGEKQYVFDSLLGYVISKEGEEADLVITNYLRDYRLGSEAGHLTGYLGEVDASEVGRVNPDCLEKGVRRLGQLVGRTGLEEEYECELSGIDGEELIEVDSAGVRVRTLGRRESVPGKDVKTNIHFSLQRKLGRAFEDKKGAGIISKLSGEVLALYSSPSFDPNTFVKEGNTEEIAKLLNNKDKPFFNRVFGGIFQPGSVFKPLVAIAGLEEGEIDREYRYTDEGKIELKTDYGDFVYNNWYFTQYGRTEGEIDIKKAIARSTDTFFYELGGNLGAERIKKWADKFGLGSVTGIDLPGEVPGLVPDPKWKKRIKGERWFLGNTYHLSIGQGDLLLTPLDMNNLITTIASKGNSCVPRVVGKSECESKNISEESFNIVIEGMEMACLPGGTGVPFFDFGIKTACKTGTAETGKGDTTHAWFSAFAPIEETEIVGTFLVEEGGEGSAVAAPIALEIFDFWFGVNKNP